MSVFKIINSDIKQWESSPSLGGERLRLDRLAEPIVRSEEAEIVGQDVIDGLRQSPKTLPPKYFYDDRGSELFEQICDLPEYYLTRTETAILRTCAGTIAQTTGACELVELGSGSSVKTRILLDAYQNQGYPLHYAPIDISAGMLESSAKTLLLDYPTLHIHALAATYEQALESLPPCPLPRRMVAFIGSTLGNLSPQECDRFFSQITAALNPGDYFLLGVDLQKTRELLEAAYDDSQGVTAAFNLNMLRHLNWKFGGNFDLTQFEHVAYYNPVQHQIEMHLRSLRSQTVTLDRLNLTIEFVAGETILSEISRKFDLGQIQADLQPWKLKPVQVWTDAKNWFGLLLCQRSA